MNKIVLALKSRTFWTLVLMVCLIEVPIFRQVIHQPYYDGIMALLGLLATYYHVTPSQVYTQPSQ